MNIYEEIYISVDIEATGPIPGVYSMSALGAFVAGGRTSDKKYVNFDHNDIENTFYAELSPISPNYTSEAINVGLLKGFDNTIPDPDGSRHFEWMIKHGTAPETVMKNFNSFVKNVEKRFNSRAVFMAYPASFDWTFVYWYLMNFIQESPFGFSRVIDLKTVLSIATNKGLTKTYKKSVPKRFKSDLVHTHMAIDDAIEQGVLGINILNWVATEKQC